MVHAIDRVNVPKSCCCTLPHLSSMENTLAVPTAEVCLGVKTPTESEILRETSPLPTRFFSVAEPISMEDVPEEMVRTAPASEIASSAAPSIDASDTTTIDFED